MEKQIKKRGLSLCGRFFYRLDKYCNNLKIFLGNHYYTINFIFLISYILVQLIFVFLVYLFEEYIKFTVSIFIILFLFLISAERIILQFKSKQAQEDKDSAETQYYELKIENRFLREKNKELLEKIENEARIIAGSSKSE